MGQQRSAGVLSVDTFRGTFENTVCAAALPHARVTLLIELGTGVSSVLGVPLRALLVGLQSKPAVFEQRGVVDCVEVRLPPSVALQASLDLSDIRDAVEPVDCLFGRTSDSLAAQLSETEPADRPAVFRDLVRTHVSGRRPSRLVETIQALEQSDAASDVTGIVGTIAGSRSTLWRHATAALGLTPQQYLMLRRFEHGAELLAAGHPIARSATEAGYVDQSHLHRHVKRFAGLTPLQLGRSTDATYVQDGDGDRRG